MKIVTMGAALKASFWGTNRTIDFNSILKYIQYHLIHAAINMSNVRRYPLRDALDGRTFLCDEIVLNRKMLESDEFLKRNN